MRKILTLLLIAILTQSCADPNEVQTVSFSNMYSLTIPSFLTQVNNLNDEASLQYQHAFKEFYVITIDEPKDEMHSALTENNLIDLYPANLEGYTNLALETFKTSMTNHNQGTVTDTVINNMPAKFTSINGTVEGIDAYFVYGTYEGDHNYYQVMTWTLANRASTSRKLIMKNILSSLTEL